MFVAIAVDSKGREKYRTLTRATVNHKTPETFLRHKAVKGLKGQTVNIYADNGQRGLKRVAIGLKV